MADAHLLSKENSCHRIDGRCVQRKGQLKIDIDPWYEFDSYRFMKEELDLTHSLVFVISKALTRES